jgi:hypothetical protein
LHSAGIAAQRLWISAQVRIPDLQIAGIVVPVTTYIGFIRYLCLYFVILVSLSVGLGARCARWLDATAGPTGNATSVATVRRSRALDHRSGLVAGGRRARWCACAEADRLRLRG